MRLRIVPPKTLPTLVDSIAVALNCARGEVEILPNLKSDAINKGNNAGQFSKSGAMSNNDQRRVPDRRMTLLERVNELLVSWQLRQHQMAASSGLGDKCTP